MEWTFWIQYIEYSTNNIIADISLNKSPTNLFSPSKLLNHLVSFQYMRIFTL